MNTIIKKALNKIISPIQKSQQKQLFLMGQFVSKNIDYGKINKISDAEFQVFSQWGDDGIIQYLINNIEIENKYFIEFGVENYTESNTRFLLMNNNWSGLVMDGSEKQIDFIKKDSIYWKYDLTAKAAFITVENINELIKENGITGNIGLLHIDIDGNDYWVWKAINVISPDIVIIEYNSVLGIKKAITIPYQSDFIRTKGHHSNLYYGASLLAICDLAEEKGYYFVGSNSAGNNAYFIKNDKITDIEKLSPAEGYVESKFKEARNIKGELTYINRKERIELIENMPFYNTKTNTLE